MLNTPQDGEPFWEKWKNFASEALSCLDFKDLTWLHLPSSGGYYDQDEFFLTIWEAVRTEYLILRADADFMKIVQEVRSRESGKD